MWCLCGGVLLHCFECNFLSTLVKTNYEAPLDTAEDILNRGFSIVTVPAREGIVEGMKNSPAKIIRDLADATIVAKVTIKILIHRLRIIVILELDGLDFTGENTYFWDGFHIHGGGPILSVTLPITPGSMVAK